MLKDSQYLNQKFQLSEIEHKYGKNVHILSDPYLFTTLAKLCRPETTQPLINQLLHTLYGDLIAVGVALLVGSCGAALFFLSERRAARAPYVLGAAAFLGIFVLGVIALPDAEQFKPVPRLAQAINAERREGDAVAISGVPGGNALVFYTRPVVRTLAASTDPHPVDAAPPRAVVCSAPRVFVIASNHKPEFVPPAYGRNRRVLARDYNADLYLYDGRRCTK